MKNKYQLLKKQGKLFGTIKRAVEIRKYRDSLNPPIGICFEKFAGLAVLGSEKRRHPTIVPLGNNIDVISKVKKLYPRLREWSLGQQAEWMKEAWSFRERGSNSSWSKKSTFQRGIYVQSYATCENFNLAILHLNGTIYNIKAPRGWRWDIDSNGLRLRSCFNAQIDYHPTASELIEDISELPRLAKAGWKKRKENERLAKVKIKADKIKAEADAKAVKRAEEIGVMVCLADSIRAGNCRAGSESFARNHGLDSTKHYPPSEVLALANGQTRFVALACTAALRRTIKELNQGYCDLTEHKVN